ncbi:DUF4202 domain-containing protein [Pseudoalteromonas mariniglutinosa]|uniref:DUF4202 domain-containing protein n=1 Tax=Pseudoalteromonas mariniglutinosa TaxID=206042 RepID=UPI00384FBC41
MFEQVITQIDEANSQDPNQQQFADKNWPKERLYSERMTDMLNRFKSDADELMHIAVRGQHIKRWCSPRSDFPIGKQGYHQWRSGLYIFHAETVVAIMQQVGYSTEDQQRVYNAVAKKQIKRNPDSQLVEDIASLVFIEHYMLAFAHTKPDYDEQKWIGILRRTWQKMSPQAHEFVLAGKITLSAPLVPLIEKALGANN